MSCDCKDCQARRLDLDFASPEGLEAQFVKWAMEVFGGLQEAQIRELVRTELRDMGVTFCWKQAAERVGARLNVGDCIGPHGLRRTSSVPPAGRRCTGCGGPTRGGGRRL